LGWRNALRQPITLFRLDRHALFGGAEEVGGFSVFFDNPELV
jgi:hypothetical protein